MGLVSDFQDSFVYESAITPVGTDVVVRDLKEDAPHCFAGVQFFSDAVGTPVEATSGIVTIDVTTVSSPGVFEAVPNNVISAAARTTVSWAGNVTRVRATPSSIGTATHFRLIVTQNRR